MKRLMATLLWTTCCQSAVIDILLVELGCWMKKIVKNRNSSIWSVLKFWVIRYQLKFWKRTKSSQLFRKWKLLLSVVKSVIFNKIIHIHYVQFLCRANHTRSWQHTLDSRNCLTMYLLNHRTIYSPCHAYFNLTSFLWIGKSNRLICSYLVFPTRYLPACINSGHVLLRIAKLEQNTGHLFWSENRNYEMN